MTATLMEGAVTLLWWLRVDVKRGWALERRHTLQWGQIIDGPKIAGWYIWLWLPSYSFKPVDYDWHREPRWHQRCLRFVEWWGKEGEWSFDELPI